LVRLQAAWSWLSYAQDRARKRQREGWLQAPQGRVKLRYSLTYHLLQLLLCLELCAILMELSSLKPLQAVSILLAPLILLVQARFSYIEMDEEGLLQHPAGSADRWVRWQDLASVRGLGASGGWHGFVERIVLVRTDRTALTLPGSYLSRASLFQLELFLERYAPQAERIG